MNRAIPIAVIGAIVLAAALALTVYVIPDPEPVSERASPPPSAGPTASTAGKSGGYIGLPAATGEQRGGVPAPELAGRKNIPTFDVVRVSPDRNTVVAGRAVPGAEVVVLDNGEVIGKVVADPRGEWVLLPDKPLEPGERRLALRATLPDGTTIESAGEVVLIVPKPGFDVAGRKVDGPSGSIALQVPKMGSAGESIGPAGTTVLQLPGSGRGGESSNSEDRLSIDVIDYDRSGRVRLGGGTRPGANLRIYLGNRLLGQTKGNRDGRWSFRPRERLDPGTYSLRVDELDSEGRVGRRIEIPFERAPALSPLPESGIAVVQPGNSLWRIARSTYGSGFEYTVIYEANKEQIRDPDLIYPGQVFTLPDRASGN